jgi:hypothetical protein
MFSGKYLCPTPVFVFKILFQVRNVKNTNMLGALIDTLMIKQNCHHYFCFGEIKIYIIKPSHLPHIFGDPG